MASRISIERIEQLEKQQMEIDSKVEYYSSKLNEFPAYENGLVPDKVKATKEFIEMNSSYNYYFQLLRNFNARLTKAEKREMAKRRRAKRMAKSKKAVMRWINQ